jgi:putative ribosome biogenesis GTPase RsgA
VKSAVASGDIAASRYKSYTQILAGEDQQYRTDF